MHIISVTPTISTTAYATGQALGGKLTFNGNNESGWLMSLVVIDQAGIGPNMDLVLFAQDFTPTADQTAFAVQAADKPKLLSTISVTSWVTLGTGTKTATVGNVWLPYTIGNTATVVGGPPPNTPFHIYGQLVIRGAATYTANNQLIVKLGVATDMV